MLGKILIVDDEQSQCEYLQESLDRDGYQADYLTNPLQVIDTLKKTDFDLVIQDIKMSQKDGLELLKEINKDFPDLPVFIVTAYSTWDRAIEALRLGAIDYIEKPFNYEEDIRKSLALLLDLKKRGEPLTFLPQKMLNKLGIVVGVSKAMRKVWYLVMKAAKTDSTVMIQGESGTGKELIAKALHYLSQRSDGNFVSINCGAMPDTLLESELFGHCKGAFTDAAADKVGLIELANDGTLFLDEISETSPALQVKMLRAIEQREVRPVGGLRDKKVNGRFITATNKDMSAEVKIGAFRQDLYYRLNVIPIFVPPLRERKDDIKYLSDAFLKKHSNQFHKNLVSFTEDAKKYLEEYDWPGNIRELDNSIQRAVALAEGDTITVKDLSEDSFVPKGIILKDPIDSGIDLDKKIADIEKEYISQALAKANNNRTKAAMLLKISLRSLNYKIQKYKL